MEDYSFSHVYHYFVQPQNLLYGLTFIKTVWNDVYCKSAIQINLTLTWHSWINGSLAALVRTGLKHTTLEEQLLVRWPLSLCLDSWLPVQKVVQRSVLQCSIDRARTHLPVPVCVSKVQAALKSVSAENQGPKSNQRTSARSFSTALCKEQTENVLLLAVAVEGALIVFGLYF